MVHDGGLEIKNNDRIFGTSQHLADVKIWECLEASRTFNLESGFRDVMGPG